MMNNVCIINVKMRKDEVVELYNTRGTTLLK